MNTMNSLKVFIEAEKNNTNMLLGVTVISKPLNIHPPHVGKGTTLGSTRIKTAFCAEKAMLTL